jgi:hypothetical protein
MKKQQIADSIGKTVTVNPLRDIGINVDLKV